MTKRDYRKEYDDYHASEEQKTRRQQRNKARENAIKRGDVKRGDNKEVDHVGANRKGKLGSVVKVISKIANRKKQPKRNGRED
jgi:hypothetical protein